MNWKKRLGWLSVSLFVGGLLASCSHPIEPTTEKPVSSNYIVAA